MGTKEKRRIAVQILSMSERYISGEENNRHKAVVETEDLEITVIQSVHEVYEVLFSHI